MVTTMKENRLRHPEPSNRLVDSVGTHRSHSLVSNSLRVGTLISLCFLGPALALGQVVTTATVEGTVRDEGGAVIPGAVVKAIQPEKGLVRTATTDNVGFYSIRMLPPGVYIVEASKEGFTRQSFSNVTVLVGTQVVLDFELRVGQLEQ